MTEADWLRSVEPRDMTVVLRKHQQSERKMRLFTVACWRRLWSITSEEGRAALHVAEQVADGLTAPSALASVYDPEFEGYYEDPACMAAEPNAFYAADLASDHVADYRAQPDLDSPSDAAAYDSERARQAELLREIFGNPFRPAAFDPSWRIAAVVTLARSMYDERSFGDMPILADALEEVDCADPAILDHCRDPQRTHVRGCWIVDLVLGKK